MDDIEKIFEDQFGKIKVGNVTCYGCVTACGQIHKVTEGPYSGYSSEGPEYETIFSLGGELVNTDIGFLVAADSLCDLYGLDTISTGVCIGFACELFEKGIITVKDTDGLKLTWGNHASFLTLIERIGRREGFGALLGEGAKRAAEQISGAEAYAIHCKGLEMGGYEPRAVKGYALSYAVSNIGASHTYGRPHPDLVGTTDRLAEEGKGDMVASAQREQAITDSVIACGFGSSGITGELRNETLLAATGIDEFADATYLAKLGERVVCLERAFNVREGFSRKDDTLPARMLTEPLKNAGPATGEVVRRLDSLLDEYYDVVGYTRQGIPTPQKLEELGLHLVIRDIEQDVQSQAGRGM